LTASIVNVTVGAGIFVLPAVVADGLGPAAPLAYLVCGATMALIVTCFAAAGSRVSLTGGLYAYTEVAFGRFVGYIAGVLYWLAATIAVASVAAAFVDSMAVVWPAIGASVARAAVVAALFGGLAAVNVRGVQPGARLIEAVTVAKLLPLALLVAAGLWLLPLGDLGHTTLPGIADLGRTSIVLIFAFVGIEVALVPSGEVYDPPRTVPRAVFLALGVTTLLYLVLQAVTQTALGPDIGAFAAAPLAEAAGRLLGPRARVVVLAGATISMFGYVSGDMLGTPRVLFAFARDGILPARVAAVHARFHTPWIAILIHAVVAAAMAISSTFGELAIIANVATLSVYLLAVSASFELARRNVQSGGRPFALPGGPAIPILAAAVIIWLLSNATSREFVVEAIVLAAATGLYFTRRLYN
jgi:amino acid transporter